MIPNATVSVVSEHGEGHVTSNSRGVYVVNDLAPGAYTIIVQAAGFSIFRQEKIEVTANHSTTLNIPLTLAAAQAQVNVEAQATQVSVAPSENASSVSISGKDLDSLADDPDALADQIAELAGPSAGPNGAEIYIDGFTGGDMPPKSAIREIRVNQNPFSAAYDRLGYGRVEILTKPGSDSFHGSAFIQGNASDFNSESPFLAGATKPPYHSLLYGGRVGGPLGKKASFFVSAERRNINRDNLVNTETLDSNFQPTAFVAAVPNPRTLTNASPRVDYQLTPNNTLTARYNFFGTDETNDGIGTQSLPSQGYEFKRNHHLLQISDTQVVSPSVINETRFQYLHFHNLQTPQDFSPTLQVSGAFTGGGNSSGAIDRSESHYELQNLTTMSRARHYFQFGGFIRSIRRGETTNADFNGTFTFDSLANYQSTLQDLSQGMTMAQIQAAGVGPSQFDITGGSGYAFVNRLDGSLWAQDDWRVRSNLTLSYGLRFETENVISDHADWAPRVGLSWGLGHGQHVKTVLRAGFGVFYDRFDDDQMIQVEHLNGINETNYIIHNPEFFPTVPDLSAIAASGTTVPTVYKIAPNLKSPYQMESAVSLERQITGSSTVSVTYLNSRGNRQFLTNDVNAPLAGTFDPNDPSSGVRPLGAAAGNIYEYISQAIFRQNQIIANFRVSRKRLSGFGYYTFNDSKSNTSGVDSFPSDPWNLMADYGRAEFDIRHRIFLGASVQAPFGIEVDPMIMARSGVPFSVTLGEDLFGTGVHNVRPAYASPSTPAGNLKVTQFGNFDINPSATAALIPPNTFSGPAAYTVNLRVNRTFGFGAIGRGKHGDSGGGGDMRRGRGGLGGRGLASGGPDMGGGSSTERKYAMTLGVEAQNIFNHPNLSSPIGNLNSPQFGEILSLAGGPYSGQGDAVRRVDLRLSFSF